jgi:D-serine deaminase-like pyridoxal phosphate-dependent protein
MHRDQIDTPALLLDLEAMEHNIAAMAEYFAGQEANLRPHFKTPKCVEVASRQVAAGAIGITCAKLGEAEVAVDGGIESVLIANQVVGQLKIQRLLDLLPRAEVIVAVENEANVRELAEAGRASGRMPRVIIETDVGMGRCGTRSPAETVQLAHLIKEQGLEYRGVMGYEGHCVLIPDAEQRVAKASEAMDVLMAHVEALNESGLNPEIVSAGGTGTYDVTGSRPGVTEVQAGSYVFMDGLYSHVRADAPFRPALSILSTIIARHGDDAIADVGMKSLTNEFGPPRGKTSKFKVSSLSEEHAHLDLQPEDAMKPGDRVEIYPSHNDTTINLHEEYYVMRGDELVDVWKIAGARKYR